MKPIAIIRHVAGEGPAYFATFLDAHSIPWQLVKLDEGERVPAHAAQFSGLCLMGGPMSANDALPWIAEELRLIREAVDGGTPVIGHCLGAQLMARALGAAVTRNPVKEIGWGEVRRADNAEAQRWLGDIDRFLAFHWHGETFALPEGASLLMGNEHCAHQGFVLGAHLAMQCHVEMTEALVRAWCVSGAAEIQNSPGAAVQRPEEILAGIGPGLARLNAVADRLYARWIASLAA